MVLIVLALTLLQVGRALEQANQPPLAPNNPVPNRKPDLAQVPLALGMQSGATSAVTVTTIAGPFNSTDGIALSRDGTYVLFVEHATHVIRRLDLNSGQVSILAGSVGNAGATDGVGDAARFSYPYDVALSRDGSFALVADHANHTIRKVDIATGHVTTLAGSGRPGSIDGRGAAAEFQLPMSVTVSSDGTFALVADYGNNTIRKVIVATGEVSTLAGKAGETPATKDGVGGEARFASPSSVALSGDTRIAVVTSLDHTIRRIDVNTASVTTIAGQQANFNAPFGVAVSDDGTFALVTDTLNHTLRKVVVATGDVTTIAGEAGQAGNVDGNGTDARLSGPNSVALSADGRLAFVTDGGNSTIRRIMLTEPSTTSPIDQKYASLGGPGGFLGSPIIPETTTPDGVGRYRQYQNGSIYWHPSTGAHEIHGDIRAKWASLGWEQSTLGYPTSDEVEAPDGGRISYFERGSIRFRLRDAPLTFFQQNMALLVFPAQYKGTDRDGAIMALIDNLRRAQPDVVGLSEVFDNDERDRIQSALSDIYINSYEGPDEEDLESDGGLLLLSKHPIIERHQTIYRQCAAGDCFANKGVLHARIQAYDDPRPYDVFLTHAQAIYDGGDERDELHSQLNHLSSFIHAYRSPLNPTLLMGDLNTDAYNAQCRGGENIDYYADMLNRLNFPEDLWAFARADSPFAAKPCFGITSDDGAFRPGSGPKGVDDARRYTKGARIDYFLHWPGNDFWVTHRNTAPVIWQSREGWDISDHYGLRTEQVNLRELTVDLTIPITRVRIALSKFHCLEESNEVGDDTPYFDLRFNAATGVNGEQRTSKTDGIASGEIHTYSTPVTLDLGDPGEWLDITVQGWEEDDWPNDDDSLGHQIIRIERSELLKLLARSNELGHSTTYGLPLLTGDGAEYAMTVTITVE